MNQLTDTSKPWVNVTFTHTNGQTYLFWSAVNRETGDRLTGWNTDAPSIGHTWKEITAIVRNIKAKASDVRIEGSQHTARI